MNNLLIDPGLPRCSDDAALEAALAEASDNTRAVLGKPDRREHYERVHLQYETIAACVALFELAGTRNDHQWNRRCVEFESAPLPGDGDVLQTP